MSTVTSVSSVTPYSTGNSFRQSVRESSTNDDFAQSVAQSQVVLARKKKLAYQGNESPRYLRAFDKLISAKQV